VCFPGIEQASSDAFNGQNRTKSFDRVPFTLASRNSSDFALNLSAAELHIKDDQSDVADNSICWAQRPEKLSQLNLNFVTAVWVLSYEILLQQSKPLRSSTMPSHPNAQKKPRSQSSENIEIPSIPKQTAGAVAGATVGSIAGPIGAVVGGVVGAVAGKAAEKRRPIAPARRTVRSVLKSSEAISKAPRRQRPARKSIAKSRKAGTRSRGKEKKRVSRRSTTTKARKAAGTSRKSTSSRATRKRSGGRRKRH
jgi:uncharacterized membrane protein